MTVCKVCNWEHRVGEFVDYLRNYQLLKMDSVEVFISIRTHFKHVLMNKKLQWKSGPQ
jgi:hypothetical protein